MIIQPGFVSDLVGNPKDRFSHDAAHMYFCRKICACKKDIEELLPQIEQCVKDILTNAEKVINYQKQRQTSVWRLLEVAVS